MMRTFLLALLLATVAWAQGPTVSARHDKKADQTLLTVRAEGASLRELLQVITFELSSATDRKMELVGLDRIARNPRVDAFIIERPWRDALRWIAGSANFSVVLSATRIEIQEALPDFPQTDELRMRALLTYRQLLRNYPECEQAAQLWLASGNLALGMGEDFLTPAKDAFETIMEDYPQSSHVYEAMYRSGLVLEQLGEYEKASIRLHELADSPSSHPYHIDARKALSRTLCEVGEHEVNPTVREEYGQKARLTLENLERNYHTENFAERRERAIMMARALALTSDPVQALRALDVAEKYSASGASDPEVLAVRAKALSATGRHGDASSAWLAASRNSTGKELEQTLIFAADEALLGGHDLAVLAIYRRAVDLGFGPRLERHRLEARLHLGISQDTNGFTLAHQLRRAVELVETKQFAEAVRSLRPVYVRRTELTPAQRLELALNFAQALDAEDLSREAIETLRVMAGETESAMDKRQIYTQAARIHEAHGDYDAAIAALEGTL
ncbi:MAG: hypothetical protein R3F17_01305 [Planctomycetota bacterium]